MRFSALVAVGIALATACGGRSSSVHGDEPPGSSGGGGGQGGSGGGPAGGKEDCDDERRAVRAAVNQNKACTDSSQCVTEYVGCGVTEDDCTGAVYTNGYNEELLTYHRIRLGDCIVNHESTDDCAVCERVARAPDCIDGRCIGASACALEVGALTHFKSRNDACDTDDDCMMETVGCDITEDGCTGVVYFAKTFDRAEFSLLRREYFFCIGICASCARVPSPPACISGHCRSTPD
jgi:hypothetical protein